MKRLSKAILILLAALVAIACVALLGVNLYVQSPGTQTRIQEELSKKLGVPLLIANTSLTPWSELRINGITIPTEEGNFLEATAFSARYRLSALLHQRLVIYDMRAENPRIVWREDAEGKWTLPKRPKTHSDEPKTETQPKTASSFQVEVEGFKLADGRIEFLDRENKPVATFTGVDMDYSTLTEGLVEGTLAVGRAEWSKIVIEKLHSPFKYADGDLVLPSLAGEYHGGQLTGNITAQPRVADIPFKGKIQVVGVDLTRLMNETGWAPNQFAGRIAGTLEAKGTFRKIAKIQGPGSITITSGQIRQLDLFRSIGDVLRIPQLSDLQLRESHGQFHLSDEKVHVDSLILDSTDVKIVAKGPARFNGKLALDARLVLTDRTSNQLPDFIRSNFTTTDDEGVKGLDFKIGGTLDKPKTDLLDRVIGNKLSEQFDDLVSGIFGGKKKKDDKKDDKKKKTDRPPSIPPPLPAVDPTVTTLVPPADAPPQTPPEQP